jgi:hypothetical protein
MEKYSKEKFRSVRRKKRRVFFRQEITDNSSNGAPDSRDCLATVSDDPAENCAQKCESITRKKLRNTSFEQFEGNDKILTRQQGKNVGILSPSDVEIACSFKIQDAVLLSTCI